MAINILPAGPFIISSAAQLLSPFRSKYQTASKSYRLLSSLASAECDFYVRNRLLNEVNLALVKSALKNFGAYPIGTPIPEGFSCAGLLVDSESIKLGLSAESLISLYLDGLYIIKDRLIRATREINVESGNKVWQDITQRATSKQSSNGAIWTNLVNHFSQACPEERNSVDTYEYACSQLRGHRTHEGHYQVWLVCEPEDETPVIYYSTHNPNRRDRTTDLIEFSDLDRNSFSNGMWKLLDWWQHETKSMLAF